MGTEVHAQKTEAGFSFRIWSNSSDMYLSEPMDEAQLRELLRKQAVREALRDYYSEIDGRIERASTKGTSVFDEERDVEGDWDSMEPEEDDGRN